MVGLNENYFTSNQPKVSGEDTIGGRICHFGHDGQQFTRMKNLLSSTLSIDMDKDLSKHIADFPYLCKQSGSCMLHCNSINKKQKGKLLVSSTIYLKLECQTYFNILKEESSEIEDKSTFLDPKYHIPIKEGGMITFPANNLHNVTVNYEDKDIP